MNGVNTISIGCSSNSGVSDRKVYTDKRTLTTFVLLGRRELAHTGGGTIAIINYLSKSLSIVMRSCCMYSAMLPAMATPSTTEQSSTRNN